MPGLVLRVTAPRTFSVWYRIKGDARRFMLGPADEVSLADARDRALEIRDQARRGIDAVEVKRAADAEVQMARLLGATFADLSARYSESAASGDGMKRGEALAPRTLAEYRRVLKADVLPALGGAAPREIARAHVRALVDSIRAKGHPVHANRVLAVLKSVFSWALRKDLVAASPAPASRARGSAHGNASTATPSCARSPRLYPAPSLRISSRSSSSPRPGPRRLAPPGGPTWTSRGACGRSPTSSRGGHTCSLSARVRFCVFVVPLALGLAGMAIAEIPRALRLLGALL